MIAIDVIGIERIAYLCQAFSKETIEMQNAWGPNKQWF